jgi:NADH-quinone oxidoreductase subunit J
MHQESLFYVFHFYLFGVISIASALAFVTRKSPVSAALWLVTTMFALAAMYIMLDAHFIGAIQVLVYAGAIMVVFLFVIMLLNLGHPSELADARGVWGKLIAAGIGLALLAQIFTLTRSRVPAVLHVNAGLAVQRSRDYGVVAVVAQPLFGTYLLAFEITSVLLLAAIVGAVVIGKKKTEAA